MVRLGERKEKIKWTYNSSGQSLAKLKIRYYGKGKKELGPFVFESCEMGGKKRGDPVRSVPRKKKTGSKGEKVSDKSSPSTPTSRAI